MTQRQTQAETLCPALAIWFVLVWSPGVWPITKIGQSRAVGPAKLVHRDTRGCRFKWLQHVPKVATGSAPGRRSQRADGEIKHKRGSETNQATVHDGFWQLLGTNAVRLECIVGET